MFSPFDLIEFAKLLSTTLLACNVFSIDAVASAPFCIFLDTHMTILRTYLPCTSDLVFPHLTSFYQTAKNLRCRTPVSEVDVLISTLP